MLDRKHAPGPAEAGHDFIDNEQRAGAVAPLTHALQCSRRPKFHSGRALNERLDYDCCDLGRFGGRDSLERLHARDQGRGKIPAAVSDLKHGRRAQAGRAGGIAMITILKRDELLPARILNPPVLVRDAQRRFDSGRTVIGIKNAAERVLREKIDNRARQLDRGRIRITEKRSVRDAIELLANGRVNVRMIVAVDVCPDR